MHPFLVEELLIPIIQNKGNFPQFLSQRQSNVTIRPIWRIPSLPG